MPCRFASSVQHTSRTVCQPARAHHCPVQPVRPAFNLVLQVLLFRLLPRPFVVVHHPGRPATLSCRAFCSFLVPSPKAASKNLLILRSPTSDGQTLAKGSRCSRGQIKDGGRLLARSSRIILAFLCVTTSLTYGMFRRLSSLTTYSSRCNGVRPACIHHGSQLPTSSTATCGCEHALVHADFRSEGCAALEMKF
jgi:hypothetical protein